MTTKDVTVIVQMADKTRRARLSLSRDLTINDILRTTRAKWSLGFAVDFQLYNLANGRLLMPYEYLTEDNVRDGDTLMLQPLATHGVNFDARW